MSAEPQPPVDALSEGSWTIQDFCSHLENAPSSLGDAVLTDISWWYQTSGLKHQFILLRLVDPDSRVFDIRLERAGKTLFNRTAVDQATVLSREHAVDESFCERNRLLCALLSAEDSDMIPPKEKVPGHVLPAFQDFLDQKWRGPPPTVQDIGRYIAFLAARQPNYSLADSNCFWFSRNLFHIIALRHYFSPFIAFGIQPEEFIRPSNDLGSRFDPDDVRDGKWKGHDPSSIGMVFRLLHFEEWRNGNLMYRRSVIIAMTLAAMAFVGGGAVVIAHLEILGHRWLPNVGLGVLISVILLTIPAVGTGWNVHLIILVALTTIRIRKVTENMVCKLEQSKPPEAARGDFIPPPIPFERRTYLFPNRKSRMRKTSVVPRKWPAPWDREEQIYAPCRNQYELALRKLHGYEEVLHNSFSLVA
ncbi:hypothetical protein C8F01DRAFT_291209 [Mycena amicta]|nr:hypothetical protein C8F01DRAFT_291209 [Mycena amicta]